MSSRISLLSDEDISRIAAFDITDNLDLYDPRFGNAGSVEVVCPTCNMRGEVCMGHHASLSLGISMFHPLVYKNAEKIINRKCFNCFLVPPGVSKSKIRVCPCGEIKHGDYVIYEKNLSVAVRPNRKVSKPAGSIPDKMLPEGYIISKILVPPIHLRTPENMEWPSEVHKLYEQLIKSVKSKNTLEICYMYRSIISSPNKKGIIGIMSGKNGIFRKIMMGKRVESSARAVVVGDPSIMLDELAVPKVIFDSIRVNVVCTRQNIMFLKGLADRNTLWWGGTDDNVSSFNILVGMSFSRGLQNGDFVLLNRQPSLSRFSLMCFKVRARTDNYGVFGINPQVTAPFNADFDGDEMNAFFMSNTAEMDVLCGLSKCVTDDCGTIAVVQPVQDLVTGCYLMSCNKQNLVSKSMWDDCVLYCSICNNNTVCVDDVSNHTVLDVLYLCIPEYDGSVLNKKRIMEIICKQESGESALHMLYALQLVVDRWISVYGLTVPIKSVVSSTPVTRRNNENPDVFRERCQKAILNSKLSETSLMTMINSGAKGSIVHASHMAVAIGQQYISGKEGVFCSKSYSQGLTPDEFFGHQMAAREGVVSTGISTAVTGYLNRRACKILADTRVQYNCTVADRFGVSSYIYPTDDIN